MRRKFIMKKIVIYDRIRHSGVLLQECKRQKFNLSFSLFVGNKAKGQISKRVFPENKAHQIFRKTNMSYVCVWDVCEHVLHVLHDILLMNITLDTGLTLIYQNQNFSLTSNKLCDLETLFLTCANMSYMSYVCVSGGKKCLFFEKFGVLCFLETPVLRFAFLPYYRRTLSRK